MKTAVITGVAGGIGAATVQTFKDNGWRVLGVDCVAPQKTIDLDDLLIGDVADEKLWGKVCASPLLGQGLDALINIAAIQVAKPISETTVDEWDSVLAVNLKAVFLGIKTLLPKLSGRYSSIVNVSSIHAVATSKGIAAYAASKGGLVSLTKAAALEFADEKIRVNAVLPGAIETKMLEEGLSRGHIVNASISKMKAALAERTPSRRLGRPDEIAQAILFLAEEANSAFITGQCLVVDGGVLAHLSIE